MKRKGQGGICYFQLHVYQFFQRCGRMQVHIVLAAQQAHAGDKANKPKIMISVQVRDKNMVDPASADFVLVHLRLCAFTAVDQKKMIIQGHYLGRRVAVKRRYGRVISEYGNCEHLRDLGMINRSGVFFSGYPVKNNTKSNRKRI